MRLSLRKFSIRSTQHIPIYSAALATLLTGSLLLIDILSNHPCIECIKIIYECTVVSAGFILVFCFSWLIGMCWSQLFGIIYTYLFVLCLWLTRYPSGQYGIFGSYIPHFHALIFAIGIIYCAYVITARMKKRG